VVGPRMGRRDFLGIRSRRRLRPRGSHAHGKQGARVVGDGDGNRKPVGRRRVSRRPPAAAAAQGGVSEVELLLAGSLFFFFDSFFVDL
jgi:hypothetical protein